MVRFMSPFGQITLILLFTDGPQSNALRDVQIPIWKNSDCDNAYFQPITGNMGSK